MVSMQVVYDDILKENSQLKSQVSVAFSLNELGYINHADALPKNWRKWDALIEAWAISTNWRPTNVVVTTNNTGIDFAAQLNCAAKCLSPSER